MLACCAILLLSGCATNPITGRSQLRLVASEQLERASSQLYTQLLTGPRASGGVK